MPRACLLQLQTHHEIRWPHRGLAAARHSHCEEGRLCDEGWAAGTALPSTQQCGQASEGLVGPESWEDPQGPSQEAEGEAAIRESSPVTHGEVTVRGTEASLPALHCHCPHTSHPLTTVCVGAQGRGTVQCHLPRSTSVKAATWKSQWW